MSPGLGRGPGTPPLQAWPAPLSRPVDQLVQHEARALWKEALEGRENHHLSPALSFQPCHARMGVLGSPGLGGWQLCHQVRL